MTEQFFEDIKHKKEFVAEHCTFIGWLYRII